MTRSGEQDRPFDGLRLRVGLWRREYLPFDEVEALDGGAVRLRDGRSCPLPEVHRAAVSQALAAPAATGRLDADASALAAYMAGAWSPARAVGSLLAMASAVFASDLHLERGVEAWELRLRRAGVLSPFLSLPAPEGQRLVAAFKHAAGCLPYRSDIVQEGRIPRAGVAADVRASFMPTALGERAALRLFGRLRTLSELGLSPQVQSEVEALLEAPSGLLLVAGPSGGGKTTTVYAALAWLAARRGGAHLSVEDPVEQRLRLAGIPVDQVELQPERGLDGAAALHGALRQDVDVIGLSEIRSPAEARLAVQAAHTGRLVVAGLHAGSAREGRQRLLDLGADEAVLDSTLLGVLHQRLQAEDCAVGSADCVDCGGAGRRLRPLSELWRKEPR